MVEISHQVMNIIYIYQCTNMIQSLEIRNFQSHKHSKLEFVNGVNVIIGLSDSGKSAIIRALRWLIWNRPQGDDFRSLWGGCTSIEIITDNQKIIRLKDQAGNEYVLGKQLFKAFGTEVPDEIRQALNLNEINLQQQLDRPFLLDSSPGEVAQHFNHVAHLDQIDNGLRKVQQWIKEIEQNITSGKKQVEQSEEKLKSFTHLDMFEEDVEVLENIQNQLIIKINSQNKLIKAINSLQDITEQIKEKSKIIKAEKTLNNVLECIRGRNTKRHEQGLLNRLIQEAEQISDDLQEQSIIITAEKSVLQLLSLFESRKDKKEKLNELKELIIIINDTKGQREDAESTAKRLEQEFNEIFPDICPLCNQKVNKILIK